MMAQLIWHHGLYLKVVNSKLHYHTVDTEKFYLTFSHKSVKIILAQKAENLAL